MQPERCLNIAVCGLGAFGRHHLRVYRELQEQGSALRIAAVIETDAVQAFVHTSSSFQASPTPTIYSSIDECLAAVQSGALHLDAASVCVPTSSHHAVASALLSHGVDVLVEKPIAATLVEADALIRLAQEHHGILQVGHLERFNPAVVAMQARVANPMFFEAHRLSLFTPRSLDVDVVLDLMIHDLDVVLSMAASKVRHLHAVGLPIVSATADIASVRIEFESGCVANFTASRVSTERIRKLRLFQPHQYISVDYARRDLIVIAVDPAARTPFQAMQPLSPPDATTPLPPGLTLEKPAVVPGEPLRLELEAFLRGVRSRSAPVVTGQQGRDALQLALDIYDVMAHRERAGLARYDLPHS